MNKQVIVLGMHRSGTSTIALILRSLGVNMGNRLLGASYSNPFGHAEDEDFLELHELLLKEAKGSWDFPSKQHMLKRVFENHKENIKNLIENKNTVEIWGWKEPRTTLFCEFYHKLLNNPYYICVHRDIMEVAQSLKKRDRMPIRKGIKLSQRYKMELETFLNECEPEKVLHIRYNDLHKSKEEIVGQLINFLDICPSQKQIKNALDSIKPLKHVRSVRRNLKRNQNKSNYKKALKHPIRAIKFVFKNTWKFLKYYMGV